MARSTNVRLPHPCSGAMTSATEPPFRFQPDASESAKLFSQVPRLASSSQVILLLEVRPTHDHPRATSKKGASCLRDRLAHLVSVVSLPHDSNQKILPLFSAFCRAQRVLQQRNHHCSYFSGRYSFHAMTSHHWHTNPHSLGCCRNNNPPLSDAYPKFLNLP
jgi:hypothetical protein